jgi:biopolymer transport protein ExbD
MAFRFGDSSDDLGDLAEINVTPLVDVMLVLLIIFMITAPMLTQGLEVALPQAEGRSFELA